MRIDSVTVKNFRLLSDVALSLEERTTVIVGRNNSGKTSLTELFRRLLLEKSPSFRLEDFSCCTHDSFWAAFELSQNGSVEEVRNALPVIEVSLKIRYDQDEVNLGTLGEFIIDVNEACTDTLVVIRYQLADGKTDSLFDGLSIGNAESRTKAKTDFFRAMKERVPTLFQRRLEAVDPNDLTNRKPLDWVKLHLLLQSGFINAQRWLDDTTQKDNDVLGSVLEALFKTANSESADETDRMAAQSLDSAVQDMQSKLDEDFNKNLTDLIPALSLFGYPGLSDPRLRTETTLDVQRLLTNHTKIRYEGTTDVSLPEAYNGLGPRNLIFILLQLLEFFKSFKARATSPGIHLIFIEEPEAHQHPQMAEVFIRKLSEIADLFAMTYNAGVAWPVQFVVSTHSSHMANEARFESIRYFLATPEEHAKHLRKTRIKDLRQGLSGTPKADRDFLHQYMTLTRCDLFFADKAALIEGCSERLLLPKMIEKVDIAQPSGPKLSSQYVSIVEVCGAYAHLFFDLLQFLELRTLIITDLDSAKENQASRLEACKVNEGTHTTNGCIKKWFGNEDTTPAVLVQKTAAAKTHGRLRLAYEVPESAGGPCGRSFEDAFILANPSLFELTNIADAEKANHAWTLAADQRKSEFAIRHAIDITDWAVPRYIAEGLRWLAEGVPDLVDEAIPAPVVQPVQEPTPSQPEATNV